jgi:ABC-2 type transport system ATP-binding protein
MQDSPNISLKNLSKKYSDSATYAVKDINLNIQPGEVYGFLGPNGAGKSTTIRMLLNFLQPTNGTATICGLDVVKDSVEVKKSIGYLSGDLSLYPKMTGEQYLKYMGELQPATSQAYIKELIKRFDAEPKKKLGQLSRGNRQKFGIIQAFMHQPKVLILDEPTSGLDPLMQEEFYKLVEEFKLKGASIFMSSHIMSEVQRICDRVGIIKDGKLISELSIAEMEGKASHTFDITFKNKVPKKELSLIKECKILSYGDRDVSLMMQGKLSSLFAVLAKHEVSKVNIRSADLDNEFLQFYKDRNK